jgi:hypothetical protein
VLRVAQVAALAASKPMHTLRGPVGLATRFTVPSARSGDLPGNGKMRLVMRTTEDPADPLSKLVSAEQSLRLDYLAFAVDPLGLYRTLSHGLLVGRRQGTIRTPASLPLSLTSRLWAAI